MIVKKICVVYHRLFFKFVYAVGCDMFIVYHHIWRKSIFFGDFSPKKYNFRCFLQFERSVFMNNPQQIAELIRMQTTLQKISIRQMLKEIGLGVNSLSHLDNGSMPKADNLGKIADYLGVSVDYLLGRTDTPTGYSDIKNSFTVGNGSTQTIGSNNTINTNQDINVYEREVLSILRSLSPKEQMKLLGQIYDWDEELKKKEA